MLPIINPVELAHKLLITVALVTLWVIIYVILVKLDTMLIHQVLAHNANKVLVYQNVKYQIVNK